MNQRLTTRSDPEPKICTRGSAAWKPSSFDETARSVTAVAATEEPATKHVKEVMTKPEKAVTIEKININKADVDTLANIKGIGRETAENIISHRTEVGAFEKIEDLKQLKGIGEEPLEQIKPYISVH